MDNAAVFRSVAHPGSKGLGLIYSRALARPVGALMLPVMIVTLVQVLLGDSVFPSMFFAAAAALAVASLWTHFQLRNTLVELHVRGQRIAVRSVLDVVLDRPLHWQPLFSAQQQRDGLHVYTDDYTFRLHRVDWPEYNRLHDTLSPTSSSHGPAFCPNNTVF